MKSNKPLSTQGKNKRAAWMKRELLVALILLIAGGAGAWYFLAGPGAAKAEAGDQSETVTQTTPVTRGDISISASGSGTLVAKTSADLSFSTSGTVIELNVKVGDAVKEGDVLAKLGNAGALEADVASAQLTLLQAKQSLASLQNNADVALAEAYQTWVKSQQTYADALTASQRSVLARCSQEVTTRYAAALDRAKDRLKNIKAESAGSDAWITAKNDYDTALANYTYCAAYTSSEKSDAQSALEVARVAQAQAEETYNTLKAASGVDPVELAVAEAKVKQAETQLAEAQDNLTGITLVAPFDGKVTSIAAGQGAIVDTSTYITVADFSHPTINVSIDETDMDKLVVGNSAEVSFDALLDDVFTGKVVQADPQLTSTGNYRVGKGLVELDESAVKTVSTLPLGLNASVKIISQQAKNTLLVPLSALKDLGDGEYAVMLMGSDGQLKLQTVTVGLKDDNYAQITAGLAEGDVVSTGTVNASLSKNTNSTNTNSSQMMPEGGPPPDGGGFPPMP